MTTAELWATWLTAGGTILAALVPGVLWFFERRDRKQTQEEMDVLRGLEAEERRLAQARRVVVTREQASTMAVGQVTAHNMSDLPIYGAHIVHVGKTVDNVREITGNVGEREGVPPGASFTERVRGMRKEDEAWLRFVDSAGYIWFRSITGELTPSHEMLRRFDEAGIKIAPFLLKEAPRL